MATNNRPSRDTHPTTQRPHPECQLHMVKSIDGIKSDMANGFSELKTSLKLIQITLDSRGANLSKIAGIIEGNGVMGHKQLVREFQGHIEQHKSTGSKRWQVLSALGVGICLAVVNVWLMVTVVRQAEPRDYVEHVESQRQKNLSPFPLTM